MEKEFTCIYMYQVVGDQISSYCDFLNFSCQYLDDICQHKVQLLDLFLR